MRTILVLTAAALSLAACSKDAPEADEATPTADSNLDGVSLAEGSVRPIMIGKDGPQMDACGSLGTVAADTIVRTGPSDTAVDTARLKAGQQVKMCDASEDGSWLGVIYHPSLPELPDCGVGSPVAEVQPYRGACSSGWVPASAVELIAG